MPSSAEYRRAYYAKNREKVLAWNRASVVKNPEPSRRAKRLYKKRHKDKLNEAQRVSHKTRIGSDLQYYWKRRLRNRINSVLLRRNAVKADLSQSLLGCSVVHFVSHIQSMFRPGMSWDNRYEWDIDHIRPCASFDLTNPDQQRECFNFRNLQPLWKNENKQKGASYSR